MIGCYFAIIYHMMDLFLFHNYYVLAFKQFADIKMKIKLKFLKI